MQRVAEDLESIADWCCANHLPINPDKSTEACALWNTATCLKAT